MDIFLSQLIQFYLNNTLNLQASTPHCALCYTHKMAIVLRPHIMRRHITLCISTLRHRVNEREASTLQRLNEEIFRLFHHLRSEIVDPVSNLTCTGQRNHHMTIAY